MEIPWKRCEVEDRKKALLSFSVAFLFSWSFLFVLFVVDGLASSGLRLRVNNYGAFLSTQSQDIKEEKDICRGSWPKKLEAFNANVKKRITFTWDLSVAIARIQE